MVRENRMKRALIATILSMLIGSLSPHTRADDIDIYLNPNAPANATPIVMLTLDYRSNLGSTACNGTECDFFLAPVPLTYKNASNVDKNYLTKTGANYTFFDVLRASLKYVLQQVGSSGVRIGLAQSHNHNNNCAGPGASGCSDGGYILIGASELGTQAQRDAFYAKLEAIPIPGGTVSHSYQGKELFFELFRYFGGKPWFNMQNGWTDRGTDASFNIDQADDYAPANADVPLTWDPGIVSGTNYISPVTDACTKLYTINFMFQVSNQEDDSDSAITATAGSGGMGGINLSGNNNKFSTVIRWMYDNDNLPSVAEKQNVISYFFVDPTKINTMTRGYAGAGVGKTAAEPYPLSSDAGKLASDLAAVLQNILSTSTTFVAPAVAVNAYNRTQVEPDVFLALFEAQENGFPGWAGNLKKFTLAFDADSGEPELRDATGANPVDTDGRIKHSALSYWTLATDLPAPPPAPTDIVSGKDGREVARGGAGSKIPGFKLKCASNNPGCYPGDYTPGLVNPTGDTTNIGARKLFYDDPGNTSANFTGLKPLNADTATAQALQTALGATSAGNCTSGDSDPTSACALLTWTRGLSYDDADALRTRTWILGDLLHSKPLAINYGRRGAYTDANNTDIRIVAGSNDGFMHMFRNTKSTQNTADAQKTPTDMDGVEIWAFMPRELMPTVKTLKTNKNKRTDPIHPYAMDGAPATYQLDLNGDGTIDPNSCQTIGGTNFCDRVWLCFGLRRGGAAYYAMDVSDPDNPKFKWKITPTTKSDGTASTDFAQLGQTWSTPRVATMLFNGNTLSQPVLIFGGGYDPNKDTHPGHKDAQGNPITETLTGTNDTQGNAIFIVDANTGALIWKAVYDSAATTPSYNAATKTYKRNDLLDSIPSEVAAVDSDGNGLVDRVYVGDTGGVLWRVDAYCKNQDGTDCGANAAWKMTKLLSVGRHTSTALADDRRFFYAPAYVQARDGASEYDAVLLGSGDRENPKDTSVTNWFYMYKDRKIASNSPSVATITHADLTDVSCLDTATSTCNTSYPNGWKLILECPPDAPASCGEKTTSLAVALGHSIFFSTYVPRSGGSACALDEGTGNLYGLNLQDAAAVEDLYPGNNTSTTTLFRRDRFRQLTSKGMPSEIVPVGGGRYLGGDFRPGDSGAKPGYRTYWYEKKR